MTHNSANDNDINLSTPVTQLRKVGKKRAGELAKLGIKNVSDLLRYMPMRYEYESGQTKIKELIVNSIGQTNGQVVAARVVGKSGRGGGGFGGGKGGGGKARFEVILEDETGRLLLTWFNGAYLRHQIHPSHQLHVQGKVQTYGGYRQIVNPRWEIIDEKNCDNDESVSQTSGAKVDADLKNEGRLRPVYPALEKLSSRVIQELIEQILESALKKVSDPLDADFVNKLAMPKLADAFLMAHKPEDKQQALTARRRLAYNELLLLQLGIAIKRDYVRNQQTSPALHHSKAINEHILARFPFKLTDSQHKVIEEIAYDLRSVKPMNRLLQGDVGSGKTVIALYALLMAVADNKQGVLMAPTQLLAEQHYVSISKMLEGSNVRIALLTNAQNSASKQERNKLLKKLSTGTIDIIIGTHALLNDEIKFSSLAVAIIDEQHRFGVMQRAHFKNPNSTIAKEKGNCTEEGGEDRSTEDSKYSSIPHHLVMTATPIPRTLSLTIFGDLDVSTIHGLPPGRQPVTNRLVEPGQSDKVYDYLLKRIKKGEQAYVVVPMVEDSQEETVIGLKNVHTHADFLKEKFTDNAKIGIMHGKLLREDREKVMQDFRAGNIDILVATTVIEVGVDVANATVMIIEHAERFGLAQLHQLRGRIGRGSGTQNPLCVFIGEPKTEEGQKRLEAIAKTNDGFKIAEMDLELRGMGEFFGTRQSGMPPLRIAKIPDDMELLQQARRDAKQIIDSDPTLNADNHILLRKILMQEYGQALGIIDTG